MSPEVKTDPQGGAGTIATIGNLKEMSPEWLVGASMLGLVSLYVGIASPFLFSDEEWHATPRSKTKISFTQIYDYSMDYPKGSPKSLGEVTYKELHSGTILLNGKKVATAPLQLFQSKRNRQHPERMD